MTTPAVENVMPASYVLRPSDAGGYLTIVEGTRWVKTGKQHLVLPPGVHQLILTADAAMDWLAIRPFQDGRFTYLPVGGADLFSIGANQRIMATLIVDKNTTQVGITMAANPGNAGKRLGLTVIPMPAT